MSQEMKTCSTCGNLIRGYPKYCFRFRNNGEDASEVEPSGRHKWTIRGSLNSHLVHQMEITMPEAQGCIHHSEDRCQWAGQSALTEEEKEAALKKAKEDLAAYLLNRNGPSPYQEALGNTPTWKEAHIGWKRSGLLSKKEEDNA